MKRPLQMSVMTVDETENMNNTNKRGEKIEDTILNRRMTNICA